MISFSLKFAIRHLVKNKLYSAIKITGLALGMTAVLLAALYIRDEKNFDSFHEKNAQLFRITTARTNAHGETISGSTSQVQGPAFTAKIPEIIGYTRVWSGYNTNIVGEKGSFEVDVTYADAPFFEFFSFPLLAGQPHNVLENMHSIVLTEETARKLFGTTAVIGKTLKAEGEPGSASFIVTGIARSLPANSSLQFEAVVPFKYMQSSFNDEDWLNAYLSTFVLLTPGVNVAKVEAGMARVFEQLAAGQLKQSKIKPGDIRYGLQEMSHVHLGIFSKSGGAKTGDDGNIRGASLAVYAYILGSIALFIMIMAAINFLNLSVATLIERHKEIGMRKICGSSRGQLVSQLSVEGTLICIVACALSLVLLLVILPHFNQLVERNILLMWPGDIVYLVGGWMVMVACIVVIAIVPAIKLNKKDAVSLLNSRQQWRENKIGQTALIVVQFACAIGLVFSSVVFYRQMNFIAEKDLGFKPQNLLQLRLPPARWDAGLASSMKNELRNLKSVAGVTGGSMHNYGAKNFLLNEEQYNVNEFHIDESYIPVMGIRLQNGRNFSASMPTDSLAVIVNESFLKKTGLTNALFQQVRVDGEPPKTIIGVIQDYHTGSLKNEIAPQVLALGENENFILQLKEGKATEAIPAIGQVFKKFYPNHYYHFSFLEDVVNDHYVGEQRWKKIITYATVMAVLICCIGLFGLAHFAAFKRTREIGIRKVLGANVGNILRVVLDDFIRPVLLSAVVVAPLAWYATNEWLKDFSYRVSINAWDIGLTIFTALSLASIVVCSQVIGVAVQSPVKSLRIN